MKQTIDTGTLSASLHRAFPRLDRTDQRIGIATYRLLAGGRAVTTHQIAETLPSTARFALHRHVRTRADDSLLVLWPAV